MKTQPYKVRLQNYEREKQQLLCKGLSWQEYEKEVKKLAEKYGL